MVHHCPRCELRFRNESELTEHLALDHHAPHEAWERYRYPASGRQRPLYDSDAEPDPQETEARRYLVVANQTLGGDELGDRIRALLDQGPCRFFVLVPATHPADYPTGALTYAGTLAGADDHAAEGDDGAAQARWRLRQSIESLRSLGADVHGEIGSSDPFTAVQELLRRERFDEIILSTLPSGLSRWLGMDLPRRLERHFNLPVTTITAQA